MNKLLYCLFIISMISSCHNSEKPLSKQAEIETLDSSSNQDECVFDTSYFKFTSEALAEYDKTLNFSWSDTNKQATAILENGDTLYLTIGGCVHFNYSATLHSSIPFDQNRELTDRAKWLAKTFFTNGFGTDYEIMINKGYYQPTILDDSLNIRSFEMILPDTIETNNFYDGFNFTRNGDRTIIYIGAYVN